MKTIFCDIDGTLLLHHYNEYHINEPIVLPGVVDKINEWFAKGYYIVITSARDECHLDITKEQLEKCGIRYHRIMLGLPNFPRYVINDDKPYCNMSETAFGITVKRDKGLEGLDI